jgi:Nuclease-related domain
LGGRPTARRPRLAGLSFPRRQQLRRLARAAGAAAASTLAVILAIAVALAGLTLIACALLLAAVASGLYARHWTRLAGRAAVGARSEARVRRALAALEAEGWRLRHGLPWHRGDIDHVAIAPTGVAFAIETKTRRYEPRHLDTVRAQAAWLRRRRRRWCPNGAGAVLCLTRGPRREGHDRDVLVVSVDRLPAALRVAAGTVQRPAFLLRSPAHSAGGQGRGEDAAEGQTPSA